MPESAKKRLIGAQPSHCSTHLLSLPKYTVETAPNLDAAALMASSVGVEVKGPTQTVALGLPRSRRGARGARGAAGAPAADAGLRVALAAGLDTAGAVRGARFLRARAASTRAVLPSTDVPFSANALATDNWSTNFTNATWLQTHNTTQYTHQQHKQLHAVTHNSSEHTLGTRSGCCQSRHNQRSAQRFALGQHHAGPTPRQSPG